MAAPVMLFLFCLYLSCFSLCSTGFRKDIFATKTAYAAAHNVEKLVQENEFLTSKFEGKQCFAVNLQGVVRHGARFPGFKDIRRMTELHKKLKLAVKSDQFPFLNSWENEFDESEEKQLVDEGADEQFGIGQRFGKRFRALFSHNVDNVRFVTSTKERTIDSAQAFYEGFTEEVLNEAHDDLTHDTKEELLRFHTQCRRFFQAVENNNTHVKIHKKFKDSKEMKYVAEQVKQRLGLEHLDLGADDLKLIYFWCTFEMIILDKDDWCHMLTDEEREILEYHSDLKQYWEKVYGHPVISEMACQLVQTLFKDLRAAAEESLKPPGRTKANVATFYFGHAETIAPLYGALGLFKDAEPLMDNNYESMRNRVFRSSKILSFSANIVLALYKCDGKETAGNSMDDFVIQYFVNEKAVINPVCGDYVCKFEDVWKAYTRHIEECDFEKSCNVPHLHDEL